MLYCKNIYYYNLFFYLLVKQKLVVEYDENGEIIDTDDEVEEPTIKKKAIRKKQLVTTKDIINYAMDQMRITDNNHINVSTQNLLVEKEKVK